MSVTVTARTARKAHRCENCHWSPGMRGVPTIAPGHRYLRHVAFPDGGEINASGRPMVMAECVACACERDDTAGVVVAVACSAFCCSTTPCARPFGHKGDHSCRDCYTSQPGFAAAAAMGGNR